MNISNISPSDLLVATKNTDARMYITVENIAFYSREISIPKDTIVFAIIPSSIQMLKTSFDYIEKDIDFVDAFYDKSYVITPNSIAWIYLTNRYNDHNMGGFSKLP